MTSGRRRTTRAAAVLLIVLVVTLLAYLGRQARDSKRAYQALRHSVVVELANALERAGRAEAAAAAAGQPAPAVTIEKILSSVRDGIAPQIIRAAVEEAQKRLRATPGPRGPAGPAGPPGAPGATTTATAAATTTTTALATSTTTTPRPAPATTRPGPSTTTTTARPCLLTLAGVRLAC